MLGKTGMQVSQVGFGCEHLQGKPYTLIEPLVREAVENGVNLFDIFMSEPQVRTDLGNALKGVRERVFLQGHIGACWENGQYARSRDLEQCKTFFEDFMERLQTDYVDIGVIHFVDTPEDLAQVFDGPVLAYAKELKRQGVIRAIGMGSHNPQVALEAVRTGELDVLMFSLNPAYDLLPEDIPIDDLFIASSYQNPVLSGPNPIRQQLYQTCEAMGVGITVMKGLGAGMLLNEKASPFGVALTPGQCIHYALTRPAVGSVLVGMKCREDLQAALSYFHLSQEERDYAKILSATPKYSMRGKCMYCNHCLPCPAHIDIAQVNKYLDMALLADAVPDTVREHYAALSAHGGDCLACGSCEKNCPFQVKVINRMEKAKEIFGL